MPRSIDHTERQRLFQLLRIRIVGADPFHLPGLAQGARHRTADQTNADNRQIHAPELT